LQRFQQAHGFDIEEALPDRTREKRSGCATAAIGLPCARFHAMHISSSSFRRCAFAWLALTCLTAALFAQSTNAARSLAELRAQIDAHVTAARFNHALWGVKVVSLETGRTLHEHHAERLMSPASNSKLYAGALALAQLGGDYRIVTPLLGTAKPDRRGRLKGDLIVSGRGDPSWKLRGGETNFWALFDPFVAAISNAGVRRITGDLVADATFFHGPPQGSSWAVDDLEDYEGAEISALTLLDNCAELQVTPGAAAGQPCQARFRQPHTGLTLDNRTVTTTNGLATGIVMRRLFNENVVRVFGSLPAGDTNVLLDVPVPRPADWFAAALKEALARRGIRVEGRARSVRWPEAAAMTNTVVLGEIVSPPLRELVRAFMKPSQNLETDLVFAHTGERWRTGDTPTWRTSEQLAVQALEAFMRTNALYPEDLRFDEGSGLSRNNLTSANATLALLRFMATHPEAGNFVASLPVAGVDGTLRRRMKGTPAEGNVRAKTGTLRWVNALSGYVTSAAGERLAFSLFLNRNVAPPGRSGRDELDAIAVMLARFAGRSDEATAPVNQ
jgi:D-alanyl-D-alanine carboxypeptidase/D-alanyl-D-alanine-endopeptidase (penicillin-binding protein 4)